ncbi:MAG TPA: hypothetical protein VLJ15_02515 [Gammaproteobacteria bacterium]|nr:hypothetical protein [Gammaproteobacteria bacterium]
MIRNNRSAILAMNCIIFTLGMVLLTQFYYFLFQPVFSTTGWINYLDHLARINQSDFFQTAFILFLKKSAPWSNILFAVGLLFSALACLTLLARTWVCLVVSAGFFMAWILNWNDPGLWPFEFSFPALFALLAAYGMRTFSLGSQSLFFQFRLGYVKALTGMVLLSAALYYFTFIAFSEPVIARQVALFSSLTLFVCCLLPFLLAGKQKNPPLEIDEKGHLDHILDWMIVIIGAMLVMQIYMNIFSGTFDPGTFRESILYYSKSTHATWLSQPLLFSAEHSKWILPLYAVFEMALSIGLTLLILRGPVLIMAGLLFFILACSEIGGSATWPPDPANLTWEWELLFVTCVSFIIGIEKTLMIQKNHSLKKILLGDPIFYHYSISFIGMLCISILSGLTLYFMALTARYFIGNAFHLTASYTGVTFTLFIFILLLLDKARYSDQIPYGRTGRHPV